MLAEWTEKSEGKLLSSNTKEVKLCDFFCSLWLYDQHRRFIHRSKFLCAHIFCPIFWLFFKENKNCIGFNLFDVSFGVLYCFIVKSNPVTRLRPLFSIVLLYELDAFFTKYLNVRNLLLETGNGNAKGKSLGKQTNHRTCARWETKHFKTCLGKSVETRGRFPY